MWPTYYIPNQSRVEGIPPPRYYLTTLLYPLEIVEEMESNAGTPKMGFSPALDAEESFASNGAAVSGVLKSILQTTSVIPDHIWSDGAVISGVLVERLRLASVEIHELESNGAVISGILRDPLVLYDNWPLGFDSEDLTSAGQPVSGALT